MMLEHLGEAKAAARLMATIEKVTAKKVFTPDLGGTARTADVTAAVIAAL
jgi:tartrate dehydrogenase/decarboxylase/D-malate dehydrogenase